MKKKRMFKCKSLKENNYKNWSWAFIIGREYELRDESVNCYLFNLTDPKKEYLFHADKECFEEVKNIIGYKLVKREYRKPVAIIISSDSRELNSMDGFYFENNSISKDRLEKAGVLDLWCEPVYEETVKIPKINGVELEVKDDMISFGEYSLPRECFNSTPGTGIEYLCLERDRFFIGVNAMNEIREYLKTI